MLVLTEVSRRAGPVGHDTPYPLNQRSVPEGPSGRAALPDVLLRHRIAISNGLDTRSDSGNRDPFGY